MLAQYQIPQILIAQLTDTDPSEVNRYVRDSRLCSLEKANRIEQTTAAVAALASHIADTLPPGIMLDYRNPSAIRQLLELRNSTVNGLLAGD